MGRARTVEINGRKYDAATGKLINKTPQKNRGGSIDGFSKAKPASQLHARTVKSKTLDRKAVSKTKQQITAKTAAVATNKPSIQKQPKHVAHSVDASRQKRASTVARSSLISKFSKTDKITEAPKAETKTQQVANAHTQPHSQIQAAVQSNHQVNAYSPNASNKEKQKGQKKKSTRRFVAFNRKPKARSVFATAALIVIMVGYITYLNIPNLSLKIAASRAGIDATMPGYKPSGFAMSGPINYSQGLVTLNFESGTDDRNFAIIERASSWDSESLLANYVEKETPDYVTFQEKGLTVYVYDGSNATWVDGGIWYTIEGQSLLNSDQLLKIAASM